MPIRVLIADDTDLMRVTIDRVLKAESKIEVVGAAANFAETLLLAELLKPDVLLLDLHMPDERDYPPDIVRNQATQHTPCILAISVWNDEAAKSLAAGMGAKALFDKAKMATELIPAILLHCREAGIATPAVVHQ